MDKKIVVIMPCYLGYYEGASANREMKFIRAVNSFLDQTYKNKHLVIVSDGCQLTYGLYTKYFKGIPNIHCLQILKQPLFSGNVRNQGLLYQRRFIKADIETYLDADDFYMPEHLQSIVYQFNGFDWVYFNDRLRPSLNKYVIRSTSLEKHHIGTSNIAHKPLKEFNWKVEAGYGHDWLMISEKLMTNSNYSKINVDSYIVCHNPVLFDN
jgi:glycosyltransferase involved in cell wall biosynthesis